MDKAKDKHMNSNTYSILLARALRRQAGLALISGQFQVRSTTRAAILCLALVLMLAPVILLAGGDQTPTVSPTAPTSPAATAPKTTEEMDQLQADYQAMMADFEVQRLEAVRAAEAAHLQAEMARRIAHENAAMAVQNKDLSEDDRREAEADGARAMAQIEQEMQEVRRQLSESHRQMREASRQVARAHRDLAIQQSKEIRAQVINLGDRAVIGVVLGEQKEQGVKIIGVSPDGPADRAGIREGDIMVSLRGESLGGGEKAAGRAAIFQVMSEVKAGEELAVEILRDDAAWEFMVKAENREPRSWQSFIRLSAPPAPGAPGTPNVHIEHIEVPMIDHAALAEQVERISREVEQYRYAFVGADGENLEILQDFDFSSGNLSDIAAQALGDANIWFGMPATHGLKFAAINPELGEYFKTNRGVLVLSARKDNAFQLMPGDVLLAVNEYEVNSPTDVLRVLRNIAPEEEFEVEIKRNKRDRTLSLVMPANRLGQLGRLHFNYRE